MASDDCSIISANLIILFVFLLIFFFSKDFYLQDIDKYKYKAIIYPMADYKHTNKD